MLTNCMSMHCNLQLYCRWLIFQVESCKKTYKHEGFNNNNDFESDISPLDVGHNIYILAHQVSIA
jgi:hypothetical protein